MHHDGRAAQATGTQEYLARIRTHQAQVRYPHVLDGAWAREDGALIYRTRAGSGLTTVAVTHRALSLEQACALGEFRRDHSLLCGFYDPDYFLAHHLETDPALETFPPEGVHIIVGTAKGRLMAYVCLLPPPATTAAGTIIADRHRPLFHVELESFGLDVFPSLPTLSGMPVSDVREFSTLLRNQTDRSTQGSVAILEALYCMVQLQTHPLCPTQASLGCARLEARRAAHRIGIPLLYAPFAPIVVDGLPPYWIPTINAPGLFWPFVAATADLLAAAEHFRRLDAVLALPLEEILGALASFDAQGIRPIASAFAPASDVRPLWTPDPFYAVEVGEAVTVGR